MKGRVIMSSYFPKTGKLIGIISMLVILLSSLWLIWIGETDIRYSGDHEGTMPFWNKWIPVIVGIILVRILPFHRKDYNLYQQFDQRSILIQCVVLLLSTFLFTICLLIVNLEGMAFQLLFLISKLIFLLYTPLILFSFYKRKQNKERSKPVKAMVSKRWYWLIPLIVIMIWGYLNFFSAFSTPFVPMGITDPIMLVGTLLAGFFINSVIEEYFYRVWLQSRLELILGTWPAILLTSLLWASWHIAIHGSGQWGADIAMVIVNQGIAGLFLGYLWARYRSVWVIIIVHGLINAHPQHLIEILFN